MHATDLTDLRRKVEIVLRTVTDQWVFATDFDTWTDQQLARLNLLDDLTDVLDDLAEEVENKLDEAKVSRKRCANPTCQRWLRVASTGRPREVCGDSCYAAVRRARRAAV